MNKYEMSEQTNETNQNLDLIVRNASEIDAKTRDLFLSHRTLIQKLFPSKMDRMVQQMRCEEIQDAMDFRMHLYKVSTQFRLEALREKYNAELMMIRGHYRAIASEAMLTKLDELNATVDIRQRKFIQDSMEKYTYAKQLQANPKLMKLYEDRIAADADDYLNVLDSVIKKFQNIMDEQIERIK